MSAATRFFGARLYPRAAVEATATRFGDICPIEVLDEPGGTRATLRLPDGAGEEVVGEFCNAVLALSIELRLGIARA